MFHLRRAALRALSHQTNALPRSHQPFSSRATSLAPPNRQIVAWRGFHQARIWRAEEEQKGDIAKEGGASPAEEANPAETVTAEPSAEAQAREVKEESVATPEAAGAAQQPSPTESVADKAQDIAADTTQGFSEAAQSGADALAAATSAPQQQRPSASTAPGRRPQRESHSTHRHPRPSRILYIGNLFFEVTAPQLEAEFAEYGKVTNSRIVTDARGLSKGFGYIEFAEQEAADAAVRALDQRVFQGRRMAVQYHVQRQPGERGATTGRSSRRSSAEPTKTLFIGNMSYQMSDRDLNDLFREIRDVLDVRVAIDRRSGQPRGFAHADFIDVPSATRAKEHLEKKVVYGRQLRVDYSGNAERGAAA